MEIPGQSASCSHGDSAVVDDKECLGLDSIIVIGWYDLQ